MRVKIITWVVCLLVGGVSFEIQASNRCNMGTDDSFDSEIASFAACRGGNAVTLVYQPAVADDDSVNAADVDAVAENGSSSSSGRGGLSERLLRQACTQCDQMGIQLRDGLAQVMQRLDLIAACQKKLENDLVELKNSQGVGKQNDCAAEIASSVECTPLVRKPASRLADALNDADAEPKPKQAGSFVLPAELDHPKKLSNSKADKAIKAVILGLTREALVSQGADESVLAEVYEKLQAWKRKYACVEVNKALASFEVQDNELVERKVEVEPTVKTEEEPVKQPPTKKAKSNRGGGKGKKK